MALRRAVLVDRDPMVLSRLTGELSRSGFVVESLATTAGLTPDLLELSSPDLLLLDSELPGIKHAALLVIIRSLKARRRVQVIVSTEQDLRAVKAHLSADVVIPRSKLVSNGAAAMGLSLSEEAPVDVRSIIDEVLGQKLSAVVQVIELRIDLFSKGNFYVGKDNKLGVFIPTAVLLPVGQRVDVQLDLLGRYKMKLSGEVAWQRSHSSFGGRIATGIGVNPLEIPTDHQKAIAQFIESRQPLTWSA